MWQLSFAAVHRGFFVAALLVAHVGCRSNTEAKPEKLEQNVQCSALDGAAPDSSCQEVTESMRDDTSSASGKLPRRLEAIAKASNECGGVAGAELAAAASLELVLDCLFNQWYQVPMIAVRKSGGQLGLAGTYGEMSMEGVSQMGAMIEQLGHPLAKDDTFADLGCGLGKAVLQMYLTSEVGAAVGVELAKERVELAQDALRLAFQEKGFPLDENHLPEKMWYAEETKGMAALRILEADIVKDSRHWRNASVVYMAATCFPKKLLLDVAALFGSILCPGAIIVSTKELPGCHRGLRYLGRQVLPTTWGAETTAYVYIVPPFERRVPAEPPTASWSGVEAEAWLKQTKEDLRVEQEGLTASAGSGHMQTLTGFSYWKARLMPTYARAYPSSAQRAIIGSVAHSLAALLDGSWSVADQLDKPVSVADLLSSAEDMAWGQAKSGAQCTYKQLTAIGSAARTGPSTGDVSRMLDRCFDSGRQGRSQDPDCVSLLHLAVIIDRPSFVDVLAARGVALDALGPSGSSPLHLAVKWGHTEVAKKLLGARANPDIVDAVGYTPLHLAASEQLPVMVRVLLNASASLSLLDRQGRSALAVAAASQGRLSAAKVDSGKAATPLMLAPVSEAGGHADVPSSQDRLEVLELLLESRANPLANGAQSVAAWAEANKDERLLQLLRAYQTSSKGEQTMGW